jgi:malonyl-CoA O-methyltransferase
MQQPKILIPGRKQIGRAFSRKAGGYDRHAVVQRKLCAALIAMLPPAHEVGAECWLDLGCGTGLFEELYGAPPGTRNYTISAIDISFGSLITLAEKRITQTMPVCADITSLPFSGAIFDRAILCSTLQWIDDPAALLGSIRNVLRSKGALCFGLFCDGTLNELQQLQRRYGITPPVRFIGQDHFEALCAKCGFVISTIARHTEIDYFPTGQAFLRNLSMIGGTALTGNRLSRAALRRFCAEYESLHRTSAGVAASYEVLVGVAHKEEA